jgi:hypothetical protein
MVVSSCQWDNPMNTCTDRNLLRLADFHGQEQLTMENYYCGGCSRFEYTVPTGSGCHNSTIQGQCAPGENCTANVGVFLTAPEPQNHQRLPSFPYIHDTWLSANASFSIDDHCNVENRGGNNSCSTSLTNEKSFELQLCGGDFLFASLCKGEGEGSIACVGDTYMRLVDHLGTEMEFNDDYCGTCSGLKYSVFGGNNCAKYTLQIGCFADGKCSGTPKIFLSLQGYYSPPTRKPSAVPSRLPTFIPTTTTTTITTATPTAAITRIDGSMKLTPLNLGELSDLEESVLQESLRRNIAKTVNISENSVRNLSLVDSSSGSSVSSSAVSQSQLLQTTEKEKKEEEEEVEDQPLLFLLLLSSDQHHSVLINFKIVEQATTLFNRVFSDHSSVSSSSASLVDALRALLSGGNNNNSGRDFIEQLQKLMITVARERNISRSSLSTLLSSINNSTSLTVLSMIDVSGGVPTVSPVSSPSNHNKGDPFPLFMILVLAIGVPVGCLLVCGLGIATWAFKLWAIFRCRRSSYSNSRRSTAAITGDVTQKEEEDDESNNNSNSRGRGGNQKPSYELVGIEEEIPVEIGNGNGNGNGNGIGCDGNDEFPTWGHDNTNDNNHHEDLYQQIIAKYMEEYQGITTRSSSGRVVAMNNHNNNRHATNRQQIPFHSEEESNMELNSQPVISRL